MSAPSADAAALLAGLSLGLAAWLWSGRRAPRWPATVRPPSGASRQETTAWPRGRRAAMAVLAGCGAALLAPGALGAVAGPVAGAVAWAVLARVEPLEARRRRERLRHDLPHAVSLLASALRGGAAPPEALRLVARSLPGPAGDRLDHLATRLALGTEPARAWAELGDSDPVLAGLGRSMSRASASGAPVATAVQRLAEELARTARAEVEDRARAVGVRAAVPLGLCLLPSFVLIGIVPLVAGLLTTVL